jgi:hypothetical protein
MDAFKLQGVSCMLPNLRLTPNRSTKSQLRKAFTTRLHNRGYAALDNRTLACIHGGVNVTAELGFLLA